MAAFTNAYRRAFETRPWATLAATNGVMSVIADGLAQSFEQRKKSRSGGDSGAWDLARSGRFLAFGVGMAPLLAEWNQFIENRFPLRDQLGRVSLAALGRRVAVDQIALCVDANERAVWPRHVCRCHGAHGGAHVCCGAREEVPRRIRAGAPRQLAGVAAYPACQLPVHAAAVRRC